jgi:hypothetical protein
MSRRLFAMCEVQPVSQPSAVLVLPAASQSAARRSWLSFPVVLAASLAYLVFVLSKRNIADPDLWWHLRNAQQLVATGHLPIADSYSFTAHGAAVLPFEWLAELPYYAAYKWAGLTGVFVLVFLLCTAIVLGIFRVSYLASGDVKNSFLFSIGAAILAAVSIGARTLLFGWVCLVLLMLILETVRRGGWKWLVLLPPLFCIWINLHGSWPMGLVVFGAFIVSGMIEGAWGQTYATRWSALEFRKLVLTALGSVAAIFVNPFGYRLVLYPFQVMFGGSPGMGQIQEFAPVDFQTPWGKVMILLIFSVLLVALFSRVRWRLDEVALVMLAFYFSLTHVRFIFLAGILLAPIFARRVDLMTPYESGSDRRLNNAIALLVLFGLFFVSAPRRSNFQSPVKYPVGAVAYMEANGIRGRLFHEWVWGGYLIWKMPQSKVFIDGRGDPYVPTGVLKDYFAALYDQNPQAVLDKYRIEYVLMSPDSSLVKSLTSSAAWSISYKDDASILLHRSASPSGT